MFCRPLFVLFLMAIVVSVLRFTDSDYTCVWLSLWFFWLCWCLFFDIRILITLVSDYPSGSFDYVGVCPSIYGFWLHLCLVTPLVLLTMLVSVLLFTASDYYFGILKPFFIVHFIRWMPIFVVFVASVKPRN